MAAVVPLPIRREFEVVVVGAGLCGLALARTLHSRGIDDPLLRKSLGSGPIYLDASETAAHGAGHMEGAPESADRIAHALLRVQPEGLRSPSAPALQAAPREKGRCAAAITAFAISAQACRGAAPELYGRHALTAALLAPFNGWNKSLLDAALRFNAQSKALSGLPMDRQPDADTLRAITLDLGAAWREFALDLNARPLLPEPAREAA